MSRIITHGLGSHGLVTRGLSASSYADLLEALVAFWEANETLIDLPDVYNTFPTPGTAYPYIVVQETPLKVSGQNSANKSHWIDFTYSFRAVDEDEDAARRYGKQIRDQLMNFRESKPVLAEGYLMRWILTGQIGMHEPPAGRHGSWIWHYGPVFTARIGRNPP